MSPSSLKIIVFHFCLKFLCSGVYRFISSDTSFSLLRLPALVGEALVDDAVERTVKVQGKRGCSMVGVVNILTKYGVCDKDVEWLASGPPGSSEYDVTFATKDKCLSFLSKIQLQSAFMLNGVQYHFIQYGKQIVACRVHWLPAFVSDTTIAPIFNSFGKVVSIDRLSPGGNRVEYTGLDGPTRKKKVGERKRTLQESSSYEGGFG